MHYWKRERERSFRRAERKETIDDLERTSCDNVHGFGTLNYNTVFTSIDSISIVKFKINSLYKRTVAFAIKKSDSVPIAETSGELFIIVFIRDIGNWSVAISQLPVTFSEVILMK